MPAETKDKITQGYVIKWGDIKNKLPKKFKLSLIAMILHKSKLYRAILDLSFSLFCKGVWFTYVNETPKYLAPWEAMVQLGLTFQRMIATLATYYGLEVTFKFSKLDIKDGCWWMAVNNEDA